MSKFKVGDIVEVIKYGSGCSEDEIGKIVRVVRIGGNYLGKPGIWVTEINNSLFGDSSIHEDSFKLLYRDNNKKIYGIVKFMRKR